MPDVKREYFYYVVLLNRSAFLKGDTPTNIVFSMFLDDATSYSKADATRIARKLGLDVLERLVTTTTEIVDQILTSEMEDK